MDYLGPPGLVMTFKQMEILHKNERLNRSENFGIITENTAHYFIHRSGKRVLTDKIGKAVWEALPGTVFDTVEKVKTQYLVSERMIYEFLLIFLYAGLSSRDDDSKSKEPAKGPSIELESESVDKELVSVIVITHNGNKYVKTCLESLYRQTYRNIEIIAVDNASKDNTVEKIRKHFSDVRLITLNRNRHYAGGINKALKHVKGEYVLILNQDTELDRECVQHLVAKARSDPKIGAVAPMMKFSEMRGFINGIGNQINNQSWGTDNFIYCVDVGQFDSLEEIPSACFGAVLIRRDALDDVGWLDRAYKSFYEDADWSFRCWLRGWKIVPQSRAILYHKFGASYQTKKKLTFCIRNRLRLVLKIFQGRIMLEFLINYMREDLRNSLSLLSKRDMGSFICYIKAYLSLILSLPDVLLKRINFMRKKVKGRREKDVLMKNPSFCCCHYPSLCLPAIDAATIRGYYRWHLLEKIEV